MSKSFKKEQERIKRWYDKGFIAVYKKDCPICKNVFYALFNTQIACPNGICDEKLKAIQKLKVDVTNEEWMPIET